MQEGEKQPISHGGHRKRVRVRFQKEGLSGFADHNVLELLLFYAIPQRDTNELAHRLLLEFGSLSGVFDASMEDLMRVDGIGENAATLIKMMPALFSKYEQDKAKNENLILDSADKVAHYLIPLYLDKNVENFMVICLNHKCKVLNTVTITEGTADSTDVSLRKIAQVAMQVNASSVILSHNHPAGVAAPSSADIDMTRHIILALKNFDIRVHDHIIIAGRDWFSMASNKRFQSMF